MSNLNDARVLDAIVELRERVAKLEREVFPPRTRFVRVALDANVGDRYLKPYTYIDTVGNLRVGNRVKVPVGYKDYIRSATVLAVDVEDPNFACKAVDRVI